MWYDWGMRTRQNTERRRDREYDCAVDAVSTLFWVVPLGLVLAATGGNPVALVLIGIVCFFGWKICGAE